MKLDNANEALFYFLWLAGQLQLLRIRVDEYNKYSLVEYKK